MLAGQSSARHVRTHRVIVVVHKGAEEEHLDGRLKAKHGLLFQLLSRTSRLGSSIARLHAATNTVRAEHHLF